MALDSMTSPIRFPCLTTNHSHRALLVVGTWDQKGTSFWTLATVREANYAGMLGKAAKDHGLEKSKHECVANCIL